MRVVKKPEERKAEMVAAAAKLFTEQGFVRTSVAEIVSAVDVAKGLFYYYFTTKDDMVKAVVEGYCSYLGSLAGAIADSNAPACQKFDRLFSLEAWEQCFSAPLTADLCLPQHAALFTDMCDRLYAHMGPALIRMTEQALAERGADGREAGQIVGVGMYGILMMARRGELTLANARNAVKRLIGMNGACA